MKKRLIGIIIFFTIGLIFILLITTPKDTNKVYTAFTNIKGEGVIDDKEPIYWNNRSYVYFKLYDYYYIAKFNKKEKNAEDYITLYYLKEKEYSNYNYLIGTTSYLYLIGNNKLKIYDLVIDNKITKDLTNINIIGIKDKEIFTKENNKYYKYDEEFNNKEEIDNIPSNLLKKTKINK